MAATQCVIWFQTRYKYTNQRNLKEQTWLWKKPKLESIEKFPKSKDGGRSTTSRGKRKKKLMEVMEKVSKIWASLAGFIHDFIYEVFRIYCWLKLKRAFKQRAWKKYTQPLTFPSLHSTLVPWQVLCPCSWHWESWIAVPSKRNYLKRHLLSR